MELDIAAVNAYGEGLERALKLRSFPIGVKWYESAGEVPEGAAFPTRDLGGHISFCQAKGIARTRGLTVAMTKSDHWCWNPLVGFGAVQCLPGTPVFGEVIKRIGIPDREKAAEFLKRFPRLPFGKYEAVVVAPLKNAAFIPDVMLIYCDTNQMNYILRAIKSITGETTRAELDGIDSCVYATVTPFLTGNYQVTFPDPGDRERALAREDEVIFSASAREMVPLVELILSGKSGGSYGSPRLEYAPNHERPAFYKTLFEMWGLE